MSVINYAICIGLLTDDYVSHHEFIGLCAGPIGFCLQPGNETTEACKAVSLVIEALRYYQASTCRR